MLLYHQVKIFSKEFPEGISAEKEQEIIDSLNESVNEFLRQDVCRCKVVETEFLQSSKGHSTRITAVITYPGKISE